MLTAQRGFGRWIERPLGFTSCTKACRKLCSSGRHRCALWGLRCGSVGSDAKSDGAGPAGWWTFAGLGGCCSFFPGQCAASFRAAVKQRAALRSWRQACIQPMGLTGMSFLVYSGSRTAGHFLGCSTALLLGDGMSKPIAGAALSCAAGAMALRSPEVAEMAAVACAAYRRSCRVLQCSAGSERVAEAVRTQLRGSRMRCAVFCKLVACCGGHVTGVLVSLAVWCTAQRLFLLTSCRVCCGDIAFAASVHEAYGCTAASF